MSQQEIAAKTEEILIIKDDFVLVELTGRIKRSNRLIDVTDEEIARKEGVYDEKETYLPRLVIVGKGWVIQGVDKALEEMVVGVSKTVEIPPNEAFGIKEAKNIRTYSIREVQKHVQKGQKPRPGTQLVIEGRRGIILRISQGRVRVDFNHPLAGEAITYDVKVVKKLIDANEKIIELIKRRMPKIDADKFNITKEDNLITIELPKEVYFDQNLPIAKIGIASEIQEYIADIEAIKFVEIYGKELFKPKHDHSHNHKH